jgi:NADH dehydrogenase [ubiquinone] 1 alpha subcomplex assembly factor 2
MSPTGAGPLKQAWYAWKALRLPWRKRFLIGHDLHGNTFWEFRLTNDPNERWRRIVKYPRSTHYSHVKVSPQWHQWLRHTRSDPPALDEQQGDLVRQARMKRLAAEADARWEAKPRVMEGPAVRRKLQQPAPALETEQQQKPPAEDPWAKAKAKASGPGETWQPAAWDPSAPKK